MRIPSSFANSLLQQAKYVFFSTAMERIAFFVAFLVLARMTNQADYGIITSVFAFCNMLQVVLDSGMTVYFQREAADPRKDISSELSHAFIYRLSLFLPFVILAWVYFASDDSVRLPLIFIVALATYGFSAAGMLNAALFGRSLYRHSFVALFWSRSILLLVIPLFGFLKLPVDVLLVVIALSSFVHIAILLVHLRSELHLTLLKADWTAVHRTLRSSLPIGIGLALVTIYDRIDILIIRQLLNYESVALYAVAYSLYRIPQAIQGVVLIPLFTKFSTDFAAHGSLSLHNVRNAGFLLLLASAPFVALFYFFGDSAVSLFYGTTYDGSARLLKGLCLALPAVFLNSYAGVTLNAIRKERLVATATAFGALLNVSGNLILVKFFGLMGAVGATIATEYFVLVLEGIILYYFRHSFKSGQSQ